jgi:hypothetical protein
MKGTINMELRDVQRISTTDEAVGAIHQLAEVVVELHDRIEVLEPQIASQRAII